MPREQAGGQMDTNSAQARELPPMWLSLSLASVPWPCCEEQPALCLCSGRRETGNLVLGPGEGSGHKLRAPVKFSLTCQAGLIEQNYITQHYFFLGYQYCQLTT